MSFANAGDCKELDLNFDPYTVQRSPWLSTGAQQYGVSRTTEALPNWTMAVPDAKLDPTTVALQRQLLLS